MTVHISPLRWTVVVFFFIKKVKYVLKMCPSVDNRIPMTSEKVSEFLLRTPRRPFTIKSEDCDCCRCRVYLFSQIIATCRCVICLNRVDNFWEPRWKPIHLRRILKSKSWPYFCLNKELLLQIQGNRKKASFSFLIVSSFSSQLVENQKIWEG